MGHKFIIQKKQTKEELFDSLVKNAIDFLDSSLDHLELRPKNSIVDLYTSIELFLKARLMAEHWTLIISKPETASLDGFRVGDFHSVFLEDSIKRLKSVLNEQIEQTAIHNFKALGEHRNQIVHFAHTDYPDLSAAKAGVVVEQWASWHHLHALVTEKWKEVFSSYQKEFNRIHGRIMQQKDFIKARFNEIKPKIDIQTKAGKKVITCQHCFMLAAIVSKEQKWGNDYNCMVCGANDIALASTTDTLECPTCHNSYEFFNKNLTACPHCSSSISTNLIIDLCEKKYVAGDDWWEEGQPHIAGCHTCQHERSSVFFIDGLWSCVSCFDRGWQAVSCPNCDEFVTGDMEAIKYFACYKCEDAVRATFKADGF